ncbi:MAG: hypothetical protein DMF81_07790 [Acidobacteria bacterium]|nr:MAG: hypothetical protein DMF81_07790 [Acidobacteriota bacterium]
MAKLIVNPTSSSRREIHLSRTLVSIGRDPSNDLVLPDAMVSRRHAVIEYRGSQYYLRDCNSSNGSLVNGDRVSERNLRDGDLVAIGTARLLFRDDLHEEEAGAKVVQHPSAPRLVCPSCQAEYRKGDLFCRQCGAGLAPSSPPKATCTACGTAVLLPARFCNACGTPLPRPGVPEEAPREAPVGPHDADPGPPSPLAPAPSPPIEAEAGGSAERPSPESPVRLEPTDAPPSPRTDLPRSAAAPAAAPVIIPLSPPAWIPRLAPVEKRPQADRLDRSLPPVAPASFGLRLGGGLLDVLAVGLGQTLLLAPAILYWRWRDLGPTPADVPFLPIVLSLALVPVALALGAFYFVYYWGVRGTTPGKRLLGLGVEGDDGSSPIGVSRAAVRLAGYVLSGLLLGMGFFIVAFGGTALHDRIAGTRVVRRGRA